MKLSENNSLFNYDELALYCEFYGVDQKNLEEDVGLAEYIDEKRPALKQLINGYIQMSDFNQEFCEKFLGCECGDDKLP